MLPKKTRVGDNPAAYRRLQYLVGKFLNTLADDWQRIDSRLTDDIDKLIADNPVLEKLKAKR